MRVTVCETSHETQAAESQWASLRSHVREEGTRLLVLPEFAFLEPLWESPDFDPLRWREQERAGRAWLERLPDLRCEHVIGAFPRTLEGKPFNQGFLWSAQSGFTALRSKRHLPDEPGGWEARWFTRGDAGFPVFSAGSLRFGLNICTELWALETVGPYAEAGAHAVITPRATAAATTERWLSLARTVAVRTGAFSLSSNRRHDDGSCGGVGWIIDPEGEVLARTSAANPFATREIDLGASTAAQSRYPRYVFGNGSVI